MLSSGVAEWVVDVCTVLVTTSTFRVWQLLIGYGIKSSHTPELARIGSTHVAHHVCASIPFYKAGGWNGLQMFAEDRGPRFVCVF